MKKRCNARSKFGKTLTKIFHLMTRYWLFVNANGTILIRLTINVFVLMKMVSSIPFRYFIFRKNNPRNLVKEMWVAIAQLLDFNLAKCKERLGMTNSKGAKICHAHWENIRLYPFYQKMITEIGLCHPRYQALSNIAKRRATLIQRFSYKQIKALAC